MESLDGSPLRQRKKDLELLTDENIIEIAKSLENIMLFPTYSSVIRNIYDRKPIVAKKILMSSPILTTKLIQIGLEKDECADILKPVLNCLQNEIAHFFKMMLINHEGRFATIEKITWGQETDYTTANNPRFLNEVSQVGGMLFTTIYLHKTLPLLILGLIDEKSPISLLPSELVHVIAGKMLRP
jgi:hypothetical protein